MTILNSAETGVWHSINNIPNPYYVYQDTD
jgi:hypothetical protein